ncbi:hypothetical protein ABZS76_14380 [Streptomyces sp. NPDC005562]|uniref:MGH1-like glycoside hydrolase domain-containing protein n=1 Tax=Streptomyces sp. NPDC005562 TaxID=3154890 RepID=UPI0033BF0318
MLRQRAARVLGANWTGTSTVPSRDLYPHQWSWDSAFIAIGLRHLSPLRAQVELETLLRAQWGDGRIPHIVFNDAVPPDAYFPGPDFWRSTEAGREAGAPADVRTSGLVQPPVHALAAWLVHRADPGLSRARSFLPRVRPRLAAWHGYLLRDRDAGGAGLAAVLHPWEQGMDNSPCWDGPLSRVEPAERDACRRADLHHGVARDRPTDLDYGRYVRLATEYRDRGYRGGGYGGGGYAGAGGYGRQLGASFCVEDPAFNALLIISEYALALIEAEVDAEVDADAESERYGGREKAAPPPGPPPPKAPRAHGARRARADTLTQVLVDRLWDPADELLHCRDLRSGRLIAERGVTGLIPLMLPALPRDIAAALVRTAAGPRFGLDGAARLVPSHDLTSVAFDPYRYWRGPAWFNTNWLLEKGLRLHGEAARADRLRRTLLDVAGASGFAEYVDPYTGRARGARGFGWTAALTLDLLCDPRARGPQDEESADGERGGLSAGSGGRSAGSGGLSEGSEGEVWA